MFNVRLLCEQHVLEIQRVHIYLTLTRWLQIWFFFYQTLYIYFRKLWIWPKLAETRHGNHSCRRAQLLQSSFGRLKREQLNSLNLIRRISSSETRFTSLQVIERKFSGFDFDDYHLYSCWKQFTIRKPSRYSVGRRSRVHGRITAVDGPRRVVISTDTNDGLHFRSATSTHIQQIHCCV